MDAYWIEKAIANRGNLKKLKECMKKAEKKEKITLAFIGGSITQGSLASSTKTCYSYLVYEWWKKKFPDTEISYINAGIGATTSQFGVARVKEHVLVYNPDLIIVEFSVNDEEDSFFEETFEGLIRKIYSEKSIPAVLILNNVYYDTGINAQEYHNRIGKAYQIPCISIRDSIYPKIASGGLIEEEITIDHLHPTDFGHKIIADIINGFLEKIYIKRWEVEKTQELPNEPLTANQYQTSVCYHNESNIAKLEGFIIDESEQEKIQDVFKKGWTASKIGERILFKVEGSGIAIQYRKSVKQPAPIAQAIIDEDVENAIVLDGNFNETWGDCLFLETVLYHGEDKEHEVTVEIIETPDILQHHFIWCL